MATPVSFSVALTGNPRIDGLTQGSSWTFASGSRVLTYSFSLNDTPGNPGNWTPELRAAFVRALTEWSNVANITFVESGSGTDFRQSTADIAVILAHEEMVQQGAAAIGLSPRRNSLRASSTDQGLTTTTRATIRIPRAI